LNDFDKLFVDGSLWAEMILNSNLKTLNTMDIMEKTQFAYLMASNMLWAIGIHPLHSEKGSFGYFMSVENIEKNVGLDFEVYFKKLDINLALIKEEDQKKIKAILLQVSVAKSGAHLKEACKMCQRISLELTKEIIGF
jgi:hypothetical protein